MFVNEDIKTGFAGMIGVYQSPSDYPQLTEELINSDYGYYLQDIHPFFTHENFYNCIKGLKGSFDEEYSTYFQRQLEYAYVSAVRSVVQRKLSANSAGHTVINNLLLYDGRGSSDIIAKRDRFVGFKIMLTKANLQFVLSHVAIQLSATQSITLYVYEANKQEAVTTIVIDYTTALNMQLKSVTNTILTNSLTGNEYIIGYYESDLVGNAIQRDVNLIAMTPSCCNNQSLAYWQKYNKFVNVRTFYVDEQYLSEEKTLSWNVNQEIIVSHTNFGLNLQFSIKCNITDLIIQQKALFVELVKQTLVVKLLTDLFHTQENNAVANFLRGFTGRESFNDFIKPENEKLKKALEETALDISSLDSTCLPNSFRVRKTRTGSL